jgi:2-isopropylmalate synthase
MGEDKKIKAIGNGPVDAFNNALKEIKIKDYKFKSYSEHALDEGSHSRGVAYIEVECDNKNYFGVGISENINTAAINALMNAINKYYYDKGEKNYGNDYDTEDIIKTC